MHVPYTYYLWSKTCPEIWNNQFTCFSTSHNWFFLSEKNWKYFSSVYAEKMSVVFHNNIFVFSIDKKLDVKIEGDIEAAQSMKSTPELFAEVGKYLT